METLAVNAGPARKTSRNGRDYLVAPVTLIVPGVLEGSNGPLYYPPDEVAKSAEDWNDTPIIVYHPVKNGVNVSGRCPDVLDKVKIGRVYGARVGKGGRLQGEAWIDADRARSVDPRVYDALTAGRPVEISTGLYTENQPARGAHNGREYAHVARNYRPDHLAVLPDQRGACSLADGCGLLVNRIGDGWGPLANALPSEKADVSPEKACEILRDGSVHGHELTESQRGMFGAICGERDKKTDNAWAEWVEVPELASAAFGVPAEDTPCL